MPTKKSRKRDPLAGTIKARLEELRVERDLTYTAFAALAGVARPQYNAWRNDGVVPGGRHLKQLAENLGVTSDWLLGIEGATRRPGRWREREELESDLANDVSRELALLSRNAPWKNMPNFPLDAAALIAGRVAEQFSELNKDWRAIPRHAELFERALNRSLQRLTDDPAERNEFLDYWAKTTIEDAVELVSSPFTKLVLPRHPAMKALMRRVDQLKTGGAHSLKKAPPRPTGPSRGNGRHRY